MNSSTSIRPEEVVAQVEKHVLVDGFRIVIDLEKSHGSTLVDAATGRQFLDLYGFYGSLPIGYNHADFSDPVTEKELLHAACTKVANADVLSVPYARFVETFARIAGLKPLDRYFFIDGGALAVENALKAAMDWKVRKNLAAGKGERGTEIIHFERAFHGRSGYTLSLTNTDPRKTDYFAKFSWPRLAAPSLDFSLSESDRQRKAVAQEQEATQRLEAILRDRSTDIAALIIEPIQGEGGDNHFRGEWLRSLRAICDRHDILLIFDEVQTGMGITGRTWCCEHFDVIPDLIAFGKKAQVCGVMAGPRLDEVKDNCFRLSSRLNSTWGSNLTDMVRSTVYLEIVDRENLVANAATMGDSFKRGLERLSHDYAHLTAVRGRGLMIAFDLPNREARESFYHGLYDLGLLAIRSGERSIRFRPMLDIQANEITTALEMLREQCRRGVEGPGSISISTIPRSIKKPVA